MWLYGLRRLAQFVPTFFGVTLVTFALLQLAPGDPTSLQAGEPLSAVAQRGIEQWRELRGLNQPLWQQYGRWLVSFVCMDFGSSLIDERPVWTMLAEALPRTLLLTGLALVLIYALSIPLGIHGATRRYGKIDQLLTVTLFVLYSLPSFWIALIMLVLLGGGQFWNVLPLRGLSSEDMVGASLVARFFDAAWHLVLPVGCLAYPALARTSRFQRTAMLEVMTQDYIRTARAKGLSERAVILRHALKNALLPVLTLISLDLPWLVGGSVVIERIFTIRGMGMLTFEAILRRDYPVIMGVTALATVVTMLGVLLGDLAYAWADPRIRYDRRNH